MYTVLYACIYRPVWYEDEQWGGHPTYQGALDRAAQITATTGRATRILDHNGAVVKELPGQRHPHLR